MLAEVKDLTRGEYEQIRRLVYSQSGIDLGEHKMQLVRARLGKRVRNGGFGSFRQYLKCVEDDKSGGELCGLLDAISTNTTHLFREKRHFEFLHKVLGEWVSDGVWRARNHTLRLWSAGCSSGEEPHSIAMVAHNALKGKAGVEVKVLASDLSTLMLERAKLCTYDTHRVGTVPPAYRQRYLRRVADSERECLQLVPELRKIMTFARFNLMAPTFPFRHGFHIILCRNVMIYFDRETQQTLVNKFACQLQPGGYLMIGHSESLSNIEHPLEYVEPTIYRKR